MSEPHLLPLTAASDVALVGGKARGLATMLAHGLPVPSGFVVTVTAFADMVGAPFAAADKLTTGLDLKDLSDVARRAQTARELVGSASLPASFRAELASQLDVLSPGGEPVAVRSSAVGEDGAALSFAGEHDSFLGVRGLDELVAALRGCWASLFSDRAIAYRASSALRAQPMAVVVQRLVHAESAGVVMTLNPANGDRSSLVVESVWGLCEPLVSGDVSPDRFVIDRISGHVRSQDVTTKPSRFEFVGDGVHIVEVEPELRVRPSLAPSTLAELHSFARSLETCAGGPADAEFAYDGRLWFVQVRPETYWSQRPVPPTATSVMGAILSTITTRS